MDSVKRKGYTTKNDMNPALCDELALTWIKGIAEKVFEHKVPKDLIINLDQTPLRFTSPSKAPFTEKGSETFPIVKLDDKGQIIATFIVTLSG